MSKTAVELANERCEEMYLQLLKDLPELSGTMAIPGMFLGRGVGAFVGAGYSNEKITEVVLEIADGIREVIAAVLRPNRGGPS